MAIVYDMETDLRFMQGRQKGTEDAMAAGLIRGMQEGRQETRREAVQGLLRLGVLTVEQIATALDMPTDFVLNIQAGMERIN